MDDPRRAEALARDSDILVIGPLADADVKVAEILARQGYRPFVVRKARFGRPDPAALPAQPRSFDLDRVVVVHRRRELLRLARTVPCVVTMTGTLLWVLWWWPLLRWSRHPRIINVMTGSDILELSIERSLKGSAYRSLLRRGDVTWVFPSRQAKESLARVPWVRTVLGAYPYLFADEVRPGPTSGPVVYLHASNFDWGATDDDPRRRSTKGNDVFLHGVLAALDRGADVRPVLLDRGPDRALARQIVDASPHADRFTWLPPTDPRGLADLMADADVVVDQWDLGIVGGIACEAMGIGRPVLGRVDVAVNEESYGGDLPPIISTTDADEVAAAILALDREQLRELGRASFEWVQRTHGPDAPRQDFYAYVDAAVRGRPRPSAGS